MNQAAKTTVQHVSHSFSGPHGILEVLRDICFHVCEGEVVTILGPSGCGKSTLLNCISGLIQCERGEIMISGMRPADALSAKAIGFAFQDHGLLSWRSVEGNILLPAELGKDSSDFNALSDRVDNLLSITGLAQFRRYHPEQLSGGMKQRVSLARALLLRPKLLLLDEPFGSLDLLTRSHLCAELSKIADATMVPTIVVTHSIEEAVLLGTRVLVLSPIPAQIVEEIKVGFASPRSLDLLENSAFLEVVAHCRSLLFNSQRIK